MSTIMSKINLNLSEGKTAVFTYGRFQPLHPGHKMMIQLVVDIASRINTDIAPDSASAYTFISTTGFPTTSEFEKNILTADEKKRIANIMLNEYTDKEELGGAGAAHV